MALFSKRHYTFLANFIHELSSNGTPGSNYAIAAILAERELVKMLAKDNPKFNHAKFGRAIRQAHDDARDATLERASFPPTSPLIRR